MSRTRMRHPVISLLFPLIAGMLVCQPAAMASAPKSQQIFGWIEWVKVSDAGLKLKAKLDTGAETSSLHALNIKRFRRGDKRLVRFDVVDPETGETVRLERRRGRMVRIREHDGNYQRRPVIDMWICLGRLRKRIEVNLVDRSEFLYPFLIGRSAMRGDIIVDPDATFTAKPDCPSGDMDQ